MPCAAGEMCLLPGITPQPPDGHVCREVEDPDTEPVIETSRICTSCSSKRSPTRYFPHARASTSPKTWASSRPPSGTTGRDFSTYMGVDHVYRRHAACAGKDAQDGGGNGRVGRGTPRPRIGCRRASPCGTGRHLEGHDRQVIHCTPLV